MMQQAPSTPGGLPSGSHFKNIEPQTRDQRAETKIKDTLEKKRIFARHGQGGTHVDEPHKNPMIAAAGSPMYIDEYDRFNRDVAGVEHKKKQDNIRRKEAVYEQRRVETHLRDKHHWDNNMKEADSKDLHLQALRASGEGAKRNQSSEHYNIVSLDYAQTAKGQALKFKDESVRYKSQLRAINLYEKSNTITHNPLTGEVRNPLPRPSPPVAPAPYVTVAPWDK